MGIKPKGDEDQRSSGRLSGAKAPGPPARAAVDMLASEAGSAGRSATLGALNVCDWAV